MSKKQKDKLTTKDKIELVLEIITVAILIAQFIIDYL